LQQRQSRFRRCGRRDHGVDRRVYYGDDALLFCVSIDDGTGPWTRYRQWRSANGETRRLYDAPGHPFESREARQLSETIAFSLAPGWDALLAATPGRQLMALSHDDRIEIHRGFGGRSLADPLLALGYWYRRRRLHYGPPPAHRAAANA
jgi:hypothetical protein